MSQAEAIFSGSGMSSLTLSIHSRHSAQEALPILVSTKNCLCPFRTAPGRRDSRDGFRFCLSTFIPFFSHTEYR